MPRTVTIWRQIFNYWGKNFGKRSKTNKQNNNNNLRQCSDSHNVVFINTHNTNDNLALHIRKKICYPLHFCLCLAQECVSVCVGGRLDGHGRRFELHCSSSLAVINRYVSFPMVAFAWRSSPCRAQGGWTSTPSLLTLPLTLLHKTFVWISCLFPFVLFI